MNTSEVLNRAADLIEEHGWGQGSPAMLGEGGLCAMGALGLATWGEVTDRYEAIHHCPAGQAVANYIGDQPGLLSGHDRIWDWNDKPGRTASEVIEVLRAAAVIEAARETEAAEVVLRGASW